MASGKRIQVERNIYRYTTASAVRYMVRLQYRDCPHTRFGFRTIDQARHYLRELFRQPDTANPSAALTLEEYYRHTWWPEWQLHLKRTTATLYEQKFREYILPAFGEWPLRDITRSAIKQWMLGLAKLGLATNTIHRAVVPLSALLSHAVDHDLIAGNPALRRAKIVKLKVRKPSEFESYTSTEVETLLRTCQRVFPAWYPFIFTLFCSGLRFGEAVALERADLNLAKKTCLISKNYTHGKLEPTTKGGHPRELVLFESLVVMLRGYLESLDLEASYRGRTPSALVFPNRDGGYIHNSNFHRRVWKPLVHAARVRYLPIKQARHAFATRLLEAGTPLVQVQRLLGHSSIQLTVDTYGHLSHDSTRTAIKKVEGGRWET